MRLQLTQMQHRIIKLLDTMDYLTVEQMMEATPRLLKMAQSETDRLIKLGLIEEIDDFEGLEQARNAAYAPIFQLARLTREDWWLMQSTVELPIGIMLPVVKAGSEEIEWVLNLEKVEAST